MANPEHLKILKQGIAAWNEWRQEYPDERPSLREADLRALDLSGLNLTDTNLRRVDLRGATLTGANLRRADLRRADLSGATLRDADLASSILIETNLEGATLERCLVYGVSAWNVKLDG